MYVSFSKRTLLVISHLCILPKEDLISNILFMYLFQRGPLIIHYGEKCLSIVSPNTIAIHSNRKWRKSRHSNWNNRNGIIHAVICMFHKKPQFHISSFYYV